MIHISNFSKTKPLFNYLRKKRENKKFIKSIEVSATFLLISFFLLFAIKPTAFTITALIGEIKAKETLSKHKMRPKINKIIQAQDSFAAVQQDYHIVESSLPDTPSYSHAAAQLLSAGQLSQIPINKINFSFKQKDKKAKSSTTPNITAYDISLTSETKFTSALSLITRILANRRLVDFTKISFSRSNKDELDSSNVNLNFSFNIPFWQEEDEKN